MNRQTTNVTTSPPPAKPAGRGDWIWVWPGQKFWPLDPRPEDVEIQTIAHSLSQTCRFTGHTSTTYSVAQHCVLAVNLGSAFSPEARLWLLLHDASEAYISDVSRPFRGYRACERQLMDVVCQRFGLPPEPPPVVAAVDQVLLTTEARDLLPQPLPDDWTYQEANGYLAWDRTITPWSAAASEAAFLSLFHDLIRERAEETCESVFSRS